jgi:hypothetical protein
VVNYFDECHKLTFLVKISILPFARLKVNYTNRSARVELVKISNKIIVQLRLISSIIVIDEVDSAI